MALMLSSSGALVRSVRLLPCARPPLAASGTLGRAQGALLQC